MADTGADCVPRRLRAGKSGRAYGGPKDDVMVLLRAMDDRGSSGAAGHPGPVGVAWGLPGSLISTQSRTCPAVPACHSRANPDFYLAFRKGNAGTQRDSGRARARAG